ncbi:MAG TPA: IclR family transcriptional regulator [Actinomycetota bacterium]|nr:IclR family transcriptional regulator [Actinomycetota bacterium]
MSIQSVRRAAAILRELGSGHPRLGVTELSERLGLAKATVYGLLRSLEEDGLVERDLETGKYRLGPALLQLGNAFLDSHEIRARSLIWADSLASRTSEAVRVGVPNGRNVLIVHHVFRPDNTVQILEVGAAIPWHASALGKAVAAFREPAAQADLLDGPLPRLTGRTLIEPGALKRALETIRRDGVAIEDQEAVIGEAEVAAAVFDRAGHPVGAIGVAGPVERLLPEGRSTAGVVAAVKETARGLSRDLGGVRRFARHS